MSTDTVVKTLLIALEQTPDDLGMRLHIADLLLDLEDFDEAASHYDVILKNEPANIAALQGAAEAASQLGDETKASGYHQLLSALGAVTETNSSTSVSSSNVTSLPNSRTSSDNKQAEQPTKLKAVDDQENITVGPWEDFEAPITLDDVGGMEDVKKRLNMAFLAPLKNPEMMKMYGKSLKGGLLLYGPPGCGKTFIARALAGELGATFMSVGLSDVLDMYLGESEKKLHEIF